MSETNTVLLFDLGGVIIDIHFDRPFRIWAEFSGHDPGEIRERFEFDHAYERHECGQISSSEYYAHLRSKLQLPLTDAQFEQGWMAILGNEIEGIAFLLRQLAEKNTLYLFSNTNPVHYRYWIKQHAPILNVFEKIFASSEIGKRKPYTEAFLHVAEAIETDPENILFFDDYPENVEGAQSAGLKAYHITTTAAVREALAEENLLPIDA